MTQDRPGGLSAGNSENDMARDGQLSHVDEKGVVRMVDVSAKADTERQAIAEGWIFMHPDTLAMITDGTAAKGDVLACARVAGIMGCKQTSSLIPMCHLIAYRSSMVRWMNSDAIMTDFSPWPYGFLSLTAYTGYCSHLLLASLRQRISVA